MMPGHLEGHVGLITGANHGIGAATARALARRGAAVLISYLRIADPETAAVPERYRRNRAADASAVCAGIEASMFWSVVKFMNVSRLGARRARCARSARPAR